VPLLFSYGTLQQEAVQLATFGRRLKGSPNAIVGFELAVFRVDDAEFIAKSGKADHAIVRLTGSDGDRVIGTVLEVTDEELAKSDSYEPSGYTRVEATLASGGRAWVYAATDSDRAPLSRETHGSS
jgi:gamma-glutamyl AIG2-like cyclotransferase